MDQILRRASVLLFDLCHVLRYGLGVPTEAMCQVQKMLKKFFTGLAFNMTHKVSQSGIYLSDCSGKVLRRSISDITKSYEPDFIRSETVAFA